MDGDGMVASLFWVPVPSVQLSGVAGGTVEKGGRTLFAKYVGT